MDQTRQAGPRSDLGLLAEFCVPAASVGAIAGIVAGGLGALAGLPVGWAVATGLALGVPIALVGSGYAVLVAKEKVPPGPFAPLGLVWLIGFPLCRLVHQVCFEYAASGRFGLREPLWEFLVFQALLSMGFAFGFMWAHEQFGRRWWPRVREHNVYAYRTTEHYKETALLMHERKEAAQAARARRKQQRAASAHRT
jgi:hypothetical protein